MHTLHAQWRSNQHHHPQILRPSALERIKRSHRRPARCQHRINQHHRPITKPRWQSLQIRPRPQRRFISNDSNMPYPRFGHDIQNPLCHSQSRTQYRNHCDGPSQTFHRRQRQRRLHRNINRRKTTRRLKNHQPSYFPKQVAKRPMSRRGISNKPQFVLNQWMIKNCQAGEWYR